MEKKRELINIFEKERNLLLKALDKQETNIKAAKYLGLSLKDFYKTLYTSNSFKETNKRKNDV